MWKRKPQVPELVESYGEHPLQEGDWYLPAGNEPAPTVVLIHGGFWRPEYERSIEHQVAVDLARRGYLIWNIDYRSGAEAWPATFLDVAAAYDHLFSGALSGRVDRTRVAVVGHSAGGHLAAWLAARHNLPADAPGHNPDALRPALAVPQGGVVALTDAAERNLSSGAAKTLIGGSPETYPERYRVADPIALLPTGVRTVLIHAQRDKVVPLQQSRTYVQAATDAGDDSRLLVARGDHFSHIDSMSSAHTLLVDALATMTG